MLTWLRELWRELRGQPAARCLCSRNWTCRQWLAGDGTPMMEFACHDCGYRDSGHVHAGDSNEDWPGLFLCRNGNTQRHPPA